MQAEENELETLEAEKPPAPTETTEPPENLEPTEQPEGQPQVQEPVDDSTPDDMSRAREMGWRPKEEWRGHPDAWRPAKDFVRRGEEVLPIVRSRAQKAEAKVAELEIRMQQRDREFEDRIQRLDKVSRVALQQQAQQIAQSYQTQMRHAASMGDLDSYDNLNREYATRIDNLNRSAAEAERVPEPNPADAQPKSDPETERVVHQWVMSQDWWKRDPDMAEAAIAYHGYLLNTKRHMPIEDNLAEVERFIEREFPDKVGKRQPAANGNGQRQQQTQQRAPAHAPAVEGGARQPGSSAARPKGWNDLPPEARKAGEQFFADGLFLPDGADPDKPSDAERQKARAAYAKTYWEQA